MIRKDISNTSFWYYFQQSIVYGIIGQLDLALLKRNLKTELIVDLVPELTQELSLWKNPMEEHVMENMKRF